MKAILYRDFVSIKNQKKNFLLSLIFLLVFPFVIKYNNMKFLNTDYLFLMVCAMVPATIGLQFSNYLLLEDKKNDIFPLLFRNGLTIYGYYLSKAMVPTIIAVVFNLLSFVYYNLFFANLINQFSRKQLIILFLMSVALTILILLISELLIFVIKNDVYYPTACIVVSIFIFVCIFRLIQPFDNTLGFFGLIILIALLNYFVLCVLLNRKYNYFRGSSND